MLALTLLEAKGLVVGLDLDWDWDGSEVLLLIPPPPEDGSMNDDNEGAALDSRVYKN